MRGTSQESDRVEHLRKAADHLHAAGMVEEALQLRQRADEESAEARARNERLLAEKLQQLQTLQAEIEQLRRVVGPQQHVMIRLTVYEISKSKLRQLGIDFAQPAPTPLQDVSSLLKVFAEPGSASKSTLKVLDFLQQRGVAKIVANPTLLTVSGQSAQFHQGGEFPIVRHSPDTGATVEFRPVGTDLQVMPHVLRNGKIRMELHLNMSEIDQVRTNAKKDGAAINVHEVETGVEIESGQTIALPGLRRTDAAQALAKVDGEKPPAKDMPSEVETIVLITASVVDASTKTSAVAR